MPEVNFSPTRRPVRILFWLFVIGIIVAGGILLRNRTWTATQPIRFEWDIGNAWFWGRRTLAETGVSPGDRTPQVTWGNFFKGYVAVYENSDVDGRKLDYAPLRLLIMSAWVKQVSADPAKDQSSPAKNAAPLLLFNTICELLSCLAIFLLVYTWLKKCAADPTAAVRKNPGKNRILLLSLAAATAAWFEPSLILDAHAWPQWDAWILPPYLFAALAMMHGRWILCGCAIALGAMLKGQILIVAPLFLLVPLFNRQWRHALHLLAGLSVTIAIITLPWLARTPAAWICVACALVASGGLLVKMKSRAAFWSCVILAFSIFLAGWICGGSFSWLPISFARGSENTPGLAHNVWSNLPSLLGNLGWQPTDVLWQFDLAGRRFTLTLQLILRLAYFTMLALCAGCAALLLRHRDPKLLVAIATPWLLMFAMLGQMHQRYILWGAVVSALALAVNLRLTIIHFLFSAIGAVMILNRMFDERKITHSPALDYIGHIKPYAPYILVLGTLVYFWDSIWRPRRVEADGSAMQKAPLPEKQPV